MVSNIKKIRKKLCGDVRDGMREAELRPRRGDGGAGSEGKEDQIGKEKSSEDRRKRSGLYTQTWWVGGLSSNGMRSIF